MMRILLTWNVIKMYSCISLTLLASSGAVSPVPAQAEQETTFIQFLYQASWGRCVSDGGTVCTSYFKSIFFMQ